MNKNQDTYFSNSSMCVKSQSQSSQVEYFRTLPFRELVEQVEAQIEMYAIRESDEEEARSLAMMIAEVYKLPPAAMVKIAGNNLPAEMVSEVFLQITAEHIEHVLTNYRQAKYHIRHTKTYLRTALYTEGSISIELSDNAIPVSGAEFTVYPVDFAAAGKSDVIFEYDGEKMTDGTLYISKEKAEVLKTEFESHGVTGISKVTGKDGCAAFDSLELGVYLVTQTKSVSDFSDCTPFFVSVPTKIDGEWVYNIDASPKIDLSRLISITVNKVWNTGGRDHPDNVIAELYRGDVLVDKTVLSEENGWSYTWHDQPESDKWYIREKEVDGYTVSYSQSGMTFTITNTDKLIQTGQLIWPIPFLAAGGILLFGIGWLLFFKEKKQPDKSKGTGN